MDWKRQPEENEYEYIYRLGENKDRIGTWQNIANIINEEFGYEFTESRYRKMYNGFQQMLQGNHSRFEATPSHNSEMLQEKLDLEAERVRLRDERGELKRIIREHARRTTANEMIRDFIKTDVAEYGEFKPYRHPQSDNDLIVHLTDIHAGLNTKNFANEFNEQILADRLQKYAGKIIEVQDRHSSEKCYILLGGDLVSGLIHSNLRLENNMNVIKQVKMISMYITQFVAALSPYFGSVEIRSVPGNHGRCLPVKEENAKGENLDNLVPWYLQASLSSYDNVHIYENSEDSIASFNVRGNLVYGVHGDKDSISTIVQSLTLFTNEKPDIVLAGHRHKNGLTTVFDTKVVESGCVSGSDNFCMDHRLRNKPEQMILVVNREGIDCMYDVQLDMT